MLSFLLVRVYMCEVVYNCCRLAANIIISSRKTRFELQISINCYLITYYIKFHYYKDRETMTFRINAILVNSFLYEHWQGQSCAFVSESFERARA